MTDGLKRLTAAIAGAYVEHNSISAGDLPRLIESVYTALKTVEAPAAPTADPTAKATSAQIRKSITPDFLISFEDGKRYKSMKRHLTGFDLTPAQYREKWGLPADYPMVAPAYSAARSQMAKAIGLGSPRQGELRRPHSRSRPTQGAAQGQGQSQGRLTCAAGAEAQLGTPRSHRAGFVRKGDNRAGGFGAGGPSPNLNQEVETRIRPLPAGRITGAGLLVAKRV